MVHQADPCGLRYLEYYEFRLVREALMERERLLAAAPHIIRPALRAAARCLRAPGLDGAHGAVSVRPSRPPAERLEGSVRLDLTRDPRGAPLKPLTHVGYCLFPTARWTIPASWC